MKRLTLIGIIILCLGVLFALNTTLYANPLSYCGSHDLPLVMEQVPQSWVSEWHSHDQYMWLWNQYMEIYQHVNSDGTWGRNGVNEFGGYPTDVELNNAWGFHWGSSTLAMTCSWSLCQCCTIRESDIVFNPAYNWTFDRDYAEDHYAAYVYYDSVLVHELGHSWGMQTGGTEDYNYTAPTVMHSYVSWTLQDYMTIHEPEAWCIRQDYKDQTPVKPLRNMVIISKYVANGTWAPATIDTPASYFASGDKISVRNMTLENTGTEALSNVHVRFYLSADRVITTADALIGDFYWGGYPAGSYAMYDFTDMPVPFSLPSGDYYVGAMVTIDGYNSDDLSDDNTTHIFGKTVRIEQRSITVTVPNGGETWYLGEYKNITWDSHYVIGGAVKIEVSYDGGSTWSLITSSTTNSGSYTYTLSVQGQTSTACRIRITSNTYPQVSDASNANFTIAQRSITLTYPNESGIIWLIGKPYTITWNSAGAGSTVSISLSRDGGSTWEHPASLVPNSGSYTWTATGPASNACRIIVRSDTYPTAGDESTVDFSIVENAVKVTKPNGGERVFIGERTSITWTCPATEPYVKIELSRNGGETWETITNNTPNDGSYSWGVSGPSATTCRIRVSSFQDPSIRDTSDADFTIDQRSMKVVSPNGGEVWYLERSQTITWESLNATNKVKIELSRNGGETWETIHAMVANEGGSYSWYPTAPVSNACLIRITDEEASTTSDTSDASFTIESPNCTYGINPAKVSCNYSGCEGTVSIEAGDSCYWTAASNADWIRITSGTSGAGVGQVRYTVDGGMEAEIRTGTLTIAGKTFTVTQQRNMASTTTTAPSTTSSMLIIPPPILPPVPETTTTAIEMTTTMLESTTTTTENTTTVPESTTTVQETTTTASDTTTTEPATAIGLSAFDAVAADGRVTLTWKTEAEIDNAGFNLYRAESENEQYIKINTSLIPAQGSSTQGATYEFTDTNVQNRKNYYYKLEDIDLRGNSTMQGPVNATPRLIYGNK